MCQYAESLTAPSVGGGLPRDTSAILAITEAAVALHWRSVSGVAPRWRGGWRLAALLICLLGALPGSATGAPPTAVIEATDDSGEAVSTADFAGQWRIVNFWATWCSPCVREIPELMAFQHHHPEYRVIGISVEDTPQEEIRAFVQRFRINYPVWYAGPQTRVHTDGLKGLPQTWIIDPTGRIVARHSGIITRRMLEQFFTPPADNGRR